MAPTPPNTRTARTTLSVGALVVLAGAIAAGAWWWTRQPAMVYDTVPVARGDIEATVSAIGTLQPRRYVDVGAQVSGQITRLHVQPGTEVKKGQLLVEIDPSVQQATVDGARAALAGLRAQLAEQQAQHRLAQQQQARQQQMEREGATRLEDLQTAEAALASAAARIDHLKAQIDQTQASLKADEARLGYTRIYAPMAGTVVALEAREGQTLNATYQTPNILRVADLSTMTVWTEVSEADIRRVRADLPVYFTTLGGQADAAARRWRSTVRQVLPAPPTPEAKAAGGANAQAAASKAVSYTVLFDVDNADGELMPQMTAQTSFVTAQAQGVIAVPLSALAIPASPAGAKAAGGKAADAEGDGDSAGAGAGAKAAAATHSARVLRADGVVEQRAVVVAVKSRHLAEVRSGLQEGEQLVTGERPARSGPQRFKL
ncbi:efflux RND transporter periplasmic adaptor subunit [Acidovorax sp. sic0104]|uniref:efflux RND transporter periplasmic adaptor subunit n=1 Tax=Acidovorax sp. sic0104 TaxID=2854784 RepID=UPI001C46B525|nr:efflux RND transporter periplasmic adaptor subunit [Acidovorax sp. sic0104]MBV7541215.1 efflux RND transporter periplasmic adaptor subunit [Acidovorax sp. sic0104]